MFKWLKKLFSGPEKVQESNIIPRILIAPDAELIAEARRQERARLAQEKRLREIESNMMHFYLLREAKKEAEAKKERQRQYAEWSANIKALDAMRQRAEVEERRKGFKLVV